MYEEFFGLNEKPFSIQPDPSFLYWGRSHRLAYAMLEYGVLNHAGISVVTGEVGCGKTTLVHRLLEQLSDTHTVALLSNIQAGRGELLSWVLMGFGQTFAGKTHVELFAQLQDFFIAEYAKGRRVVLIIDEAQNLSVDMLEELRMLSNINAGKDQLLQLILVGQPELKDLLNRPDLLQLAQRVGSDFHLTPLSREEVDAYLDTRLSIAGASRPIFSEGAVDLIAEESRGVPRVINIIADTALVYAFSASEQKVSAEIVASVISDKSDYGVFGVAVDRNVAPGRTPPETPSPFSSADGPRPRRAGDAGMPTLYPPAEPDGPAAGAGEDKAGAEETGEPDRAPSGAKTSAALSVVADNSRPTDAGAPAPQPFVLAGARFEGGLANTPSYLGANRGGRFKPQAITALERAEMEPASEEPSGLLRSLDDDDAPAAAKPAVGAGERPSGRARRQARAEAAVIGVIILDAGEGVSPEAAIRSVGEGRTIVFVTPAPEDEPARVAARMGADVVRLASPAVNPGRARNSGYRRLKALDPKLDFVQFLEADFILHVDWFRQAAAFMNRRPEVAVVDGFKKERFNEKSVVNVVGEIARRRPKGELQCTGATAFVRASAFEAAGGFRGDIPANDTDDLCLRMRRRGHHVWRIESQMGVNHARRIGLKDWWRDAKRNGYEYAHGVFLHGAPPERFRVLEQARAIIWGGAFPLFILLAAIIGAVAVQVLAPMTNAIGVFLWVLCFGFLVYFAKVLLIALRHGIGNRSAWIYGVLVTAGHFGEFLGAAKYHLESRPDGADAAAS